MSVIKSEEIKPGMKVGRLEVQSLATTHSRHGRAWTCRCSCGTVSAVPESIIVGKRTPYCCRKTEQASHRRVDYANKKYGMLTGDAFARLSTAGNSIWKFRCDCGEVVEKIARRVVRGEIKSCGCATKTLIKNALTLPNNQQLKNSAFYTHRKTAEKRGYVSKLTREQYETLIQQPCHYCGEISLRKTINGHSAPLNSVDRLNNESYYDASNSVPCCFVCQKIKTFYPKQEFLAHVLKIAEYQKGRS